MDAHQQGLDIAERIILYLDGKLEGEELERFQLWLDEDEANRILFERLRNASHLENKLDFLSKVDTASAWQKVERQIIPQTGFSIVKRWMPYAAAAVLLLAIGWAVIHNSVDGSVPAVAEQGIPKGVSKQVPEEDKTRLELKDGSVIILDNVANGVVYEEGGIRVAKQDGEIIYEVLPVAGNTEVTYNTLSTPTGGKIRIVLPDGSRTWLNAASSLRFPTAFTGKERRVELNGEGYFEIERKDGIPFRVETGNSSIEVLGTHFNVMAYDNEGVVRTTLMEGSVKVHKGNVSRLLKPGFAASVKGDDIDVAPADVEGALAWKNGQFYFRETNLQSIMHEMERWYGLDVHYVGDVKDERFSGSIPRTAHVSEVLEMLTLTHTVKFTVEGKKVTVRPYQR